MYPNSSAVDNVPISVEMPVGDAPLANPQMPDLTGSFGESQTAGPDYGQQNIGDSFADELAALSPKGKAVASPIGFGASPKVSAGAHESVASQQVPAVAGGSRKASAGSDKATPNHTIGGFSGVIDRFSQNPMSALPSVDNFVPAEQPSRFPGIKNVRVANDQPRAGAPSFQDEGIYSKTPGGNFTRRGRVPMNTDESLFPFNYTAGRRSDLQISVSRDDRMPPAEAKTKLRDIFSMFGIESESHDYLYSFTHSLLVSHALNGASIVGPGRATFSVDGDNYPFGEVLKCLGPNMRRFFRAYADETAKALAIVLNSYDPASAVSTNLCGQIRYIAVNRLLTQFPYLIHDSADACVRITNVEMAAVQRSKNSVLKDGHNAVEAMEKSVLE